MHQAEFHGVVPAFNGHFQALQQSSMRWSNRLKQAVAVCHGLTMITKSLVVGDDMERSLFKRVEAQFVVGKASLPHVDCAIACACLHDRLKSCCTLQSFVLLSLDA